MYTLTIGFFARYPSLRRSCAPFQGSSNLHHLTPPTPLSWTIMCKSPTYFGVFKISKAGYCARRWWTLSGRFADLKVDRGSAPRSCTPTQGLRRKEVPKGAEETRYQEQDSPKG